MDHTAKRISRIAAIAGTAMLGIAALVPARAQTVLSPEQLAAGCRVGLLALDQAKDPARRQADTDIRNHRAKENERTALTEKYFRQSVERACAPGNFPAAGKPVARQIGTDEVRARL